MTNEEFEGAYKKLNKEQKEAVDTIDGSVMDNNFDLINKSLMKFKEYSLIEHEVPYVYEIDFSNKKLCYIGANHTRNIEDSLFNKIESKFFQVNPDIVVVEGINNILDKDIFEDRIKKLTKEEVIKEMGESGFAVKTAVENSVDWYCPEPNDSDSYNYLLENNYTKEQIFCWYILRTLPQYHRSFYKDGFKSYAEIFIKKFQKSVDWNDFDFSYDNFTKIAEGILNKKIDIEDKINAKDFINPVKDWVKEENRSVLNDIAELSTNFRDIIIVSNIKELFNKYDKVLVVYGASHAVMEEPALRKILTE